MKINEAPEKLYLHPTAKNNVGAGWLTFPLTDNDIEYVRYDAFIEKAVDWIKACNICDYFVKPTEDSTYIAFDVKMYVEEFKKAMREDNL